MLLFFFSLVMKQEPSFFFSPSFFGAMFSVSHDLNKSVGRYVSLALSNVNRVVEKKKRKERKAQLAVFFSLKAIRSSSKNALRFFFSPFLPPLKTAA